MSDTNRAAIGFKEESTWGTAATGTYETMRFTGDGLLQETTVVDSQEIVSSRNISNVARVNFNASGDLNFELSDTSFETLFNVALLADSDISGGAIVNGTTLRSLTIEREYLDLSNEIAQYLGMMVNEFSLSVSPDALITGTMRFLGWKEVSQTSAASRSAATTTIPMNAVDHVTAFDENGSSFDITGFSFNLNNNLRTRLQVATPGPIGIGAGSAVVTGTMTAYFADKTVADEYLNFSSSSLLLRVKDDTNDGYEFSFPSIKYESMKRVAGGQNQDVILEMGWRAFLDSGIGGTMQIQSITGAGS